LVSGNFSYNLDIEFDGIDNTLGEADKMERVIYFTVKAEYANSVNLVEARFIARSSGRSFYIPLGTSYFGVQSDKVTIDSPSKTNGLLPVSGKAAPDSMVSIFIDARDTGIRVRANKAGIWRAELELFDLGINYGYHMVYAHAGGRESNWHIFRFQAAVLMEDPQVLTVRQGGTLIMDRKEEDGWRDTKAGTVINIGSSELLDRSSFAITTTNDDAIDIIRVVVEDSGGGASEVFDKATYMNRSWVVRREAPTGFREGFTPDSVRVEIFCMEKDKFHIPEEYMWEEKQRLLDKMANTSIPEEQLKSPLSDEEAAAQQALNQQKLTEYYSVYPAGLRDSDVKEQADGSYNIRIPGGDELNVKSVDLSVQETAELLWRADDTVSFANAETHIQSHVELRKASGETVERYTLQQFAGAVYNAVRDGSASTALEAIQYIAQQKGLSGSDYVAFETESAVGLYPSGNMPPFSSVLPAAANGSGYVFSPVAATDALQVASNESYIQAGRTLTTIQISAADAVFAQVGSSGSDALTGIGKVLGTMDLVESVQQYRSTDKAFEAMDQAYADFLAFQSHPLFGELLPSQMIAYYNALDGFRADVRAFKSQKDLAFFQNACNILGSSILLTNPSSGATKFSTRALTAGAVGQAACNSLMKESKFQDVLRNGICNNIDMRKGQIKGFMRQALKNSGKEADPNCAPFSGDAHRIKNINWKYDPSGFAYENGDISQRIEGVRAEIWTADDENGTNARYWSEAADWEEINPQITEDDGWYQWDVPIGWWQVRLFKDGYQEAASEWLPVLPVQLGVNIEMFPIGTAPTITTASLPNGTVGTAYSQILTVTGTSPITWSIVSGSLPGGLALNAATGVISGTPASSGTFNFTVKAANGFSPDATKALSVTISAGGGSPGGGNDGGGSSGGSTPPGDSATNKSDSDDDNTTNVGDNTITTPDDKTPLGNYTGNDNPFADVKTTDWFFDYVIFAYTQDLMVGTSTDPMLFSPNMTTTRGMIVTVLYRMAGSPDVSGLANPFDDVDDEKYYADAIKWAAENNVVFGYGNNLFGPEDNITREQLTAILDRYAKFAGMSFRETRQIVVFNDDAKISDYAREAIARFFRAGIITGKPGNIFDPKGEATRAEVAAMLKRLFEAAGQSG